MKKSPRRSDKAAKGLAPKGFAPKGLALLCAAASCVFFAACGGDGGAKRGTDEPSAPYVSPYGGETRNGGTAESERGAANPLGANDGAARKAEEAGGGKETDNGGAWRRAYSKGDILDALAGIGARVAAVNAITPDGRDAQGRALLNVGGSRVSADALLSALGLPEGARLTDAARTEDGFVFTGR